MTGWVAGPVADEAVWQHIEEASAVGGVRHRAVAMAERLGFEEFRAGQVALAVSEAASNLHKHATQGVIVLRTVRGPAGGVVEVICIDSGPGMPDVGLSLKDGHSTSGTLGIGLGAVFRLADDCDVYSETGRGTVMVNRFHERADTPRQDWPSGGLTRPLGGETACGDIFAVHEDGPITFGMVCDGLGHGPLAAIAAQEAVRILRAGPPPVSPSEVLERLHRGLSHTRGGAISVVRIDRETRQIRFAGLGNVSGWIVRPDGRQGMISVPGIAGHQARTFREYGYELPPGAAVVLHSDGLTDRWDLTGYRGLLAQPALVIAATLLRDKGVRRDDGGVLVIKPS